jgi:hypothetical protein
VVLALLESKFANVLVRLLEVDVPPVGLEDVLAVDDEPPEEKKDAAGGSIATR